MKTRVGEAGSDGGLAEYAGLVSITLRALYRINLISIEFLPTVLTLP